MQQEKSLRVLVCGGRNYHNKAHLYEVLDKVNCDGNILICHGDATGADRLADQWAKERQVYCQRFPAKWNSLGNAAGPIRNKKMLVQFKPNFVIAFPGGKGTHNMIKLAQEAGVPVYVQDF